MRLLGCSLRITVRHSEPRAVGCTHASRVMAVVRSRLLASATVTRLLVPLKLSAPPNLPVATCVAPVIVPGLFWPEESAAVGPVVSSKPHAPTRLAEPAGLTVRVTAIVLGEPVAPDVVAVTVTVAV